MPLPVRDTRVTFPGGSVRESATVLAATSPRPGSTGWADVITDVSPFHPVDPRWPDQGADAGDLVTAGGRRHPVADCVIGATDGSTLFVGDDVPVRRGEAGWAFVVVHRLAAGSELPVAGDCVRLAVDAAARHAVSAGHTGCHVAAVALNAALAGRWRRAAATDGLGSPDFDQLAITASRIRPEGSVDTYRIGKSLRKKGFDPAGMAGALPDIQAATNSTLARWLAAGAPSRVECAGPGLTDLRTWVCELPDGVQRIACGGTHLTSLDELSGLAVELGLDDAAGELRMVTAAPLRQG